MEKCNQGNSALMLEIALNEVNRLRLKISQLNSDLRIEVNRKESGLSWRSKRAIESEQKETKRLLGVLITNDFATLKGDELRHILEKRGLSTKGRNHELRARIHKDNTDKKS